MMNNEVTPRDAEQRARALDPERSFIVQAPAGSGKTSLLVARFLSLLARVESPEEIVAITFTRKAAAEMRARIVEVLQRAVAGVAPQNENERLLNDLADVVLRRNRELGWRLTENPSRLRVQTIDSLCASLTRQMPVLSGLGAQPRIVDDAWDLYRLAARETLSALESEQAWTSAVVHLIDYCDNDLAQVEAMLAAMLAKRDQWLRHVSKANQEQAGLREQLETTLRAVVENGLTEVATALRATDGGEVARLAAYALGNQSGGEWRSAFEDWRARESLPVAKWQNLALWRAIVDLLLTNDGQWRRRITEREGFPAPSGVRDAEEKQQRKAMKEGFEGLLETLREDETLRLTLGRVRALPVPCYSDDQWAILQALCELLPVAASYLTVVFAERGEVDFTAVSHAAVEALGEVDAPSDLALALDYRIRHILVDEFQDTSIAQYRLLERLTAGWQSDDGRTLFLVGDPMQSIYRFREADVGLFLWARKFGVGAVALESLTLATNFRSRGGVIDWVNETFQRVMPAVEDIATGAVTYSRSHAFKAAEKDAAVVIHPLFSGDWRQEAQQVLTLIQEARALHPEESVAVLVQARRHLAYIALLAKQQNIAFQAIEIEQLGERQVIQDLLALTRALLHLGDRTAWLAVLRAPWCGLELADLLTIATPHAHTIIWQRLGEKSVINDLSPDGRARLQRIVPILREALEQRARRGLREWVEGAWLRLGGPACVSEATGLADTQVFFELLDGLDEEQHLVSPALLAERVAKLYALPDTRADARLQMMTIHKSKGLEFDTVIVPGLGRRRSVDPHRLLMWLEMPARRGEPELILAPLSQPGASVDPIYAYIRGVERDKAQHESTRLLYVAATRARRRLHLLGHVTVKQVDNGAQMRRPAQGTFLNLLWEVVEPVFARELSSCASAGIDAQAPPSSETRQLNRLALQWRPPPVPPKLEWDTDRLTYASDQRRVGDIEFAWASPTARHVGTLVHRVLRDMGGENGERWGAVDMLSRRRWVRSALSELGVAPAQLDQAVERTMAALHNVSRDEKGQWLFDASHTECQNEYALTVCVDNRIERVVLDRTFVDAEGARWIVDYKTGYHAGGGLEEFLDNELVRYREQLERYARIVSELDGRPIKLALYFPLIPGWREWQFTG